MNQMSQGASHAGRNVGNLRHWMMPRGDTPCIFLGPRSGCGEGEADKPWALGPEQTVGPEKSAFPDCLTLSGTDTAMLFAQRFWEESRRVRA